VCISHSVAELVDVVLVLVLDDGGGGDLSIGG